MGKVEKNNRYLKKRVENRSSAKRIKNINPATLENIGSFPIQSRGEVEKALSRARKTLPVWKKFSLHERAEFLSRLRKQMIRDLDEIVEIMGNETGKTEMDCLVEIFTVAEHLKYLSKKGPQLLVDEKRSTGIFLNKKAWVSFLPRGVVAIISPWNYPLLLTLGPIAAALMAGNCVVVKPSEITTATALKIKEIASRANIPEDVLQIVTGDGSTGAALVNSENSDMVCFTGSTATGRKIGEICGKMLKPCILELGGNDPMIIFADANLKRAADAAIWGGFFNSGQTCISVERVFVAESIKEEFLKIITSSIEKLKQGLRFEDVEIGSMTFPAQIAVIQKHLTDAVRKGAKILKGGKRDNRYPGFFFKPTIVTNVTSKMKIMQEETFGPVFTVSTFRDEKEAIQMANDTIYGLDSSIWTENIQRAKRVARKLESGNVCINDVLINYSISDIPLGGVKKSGLGMVHGPEGLRAFTNQQSVVVHNFGLRIEPWWFPSTKRRKNFIKRLITFLYG